MGMNHSSGDTQREQDPDTTGCVTPVDGGGSQHELPLPPSGLECDARRMRLRRRQAQRVGGVGQPGAGGQGAGQWRIGVSFLWRAARAVGLGPAPGRPRANITAPAPASVALSGLSRHPRAGADLDLVASTRRHRGHRCRPSRQLRWSGPPPQRRRARRTALNTAGLDAPLRCSRRGPAECGNGVGTPSRCKSSTDPATRKPEG